MARRTPVGIKGSLALVNLSGEGSEGRGRGVFCSICHAAIFSHETSGVAHKYTVGEGDGFVTANSNRRLYHGSGKLFGSRLQGEGHRRTTTREITKLSILYFPYGNDLSRLGHLREVETTKPRQAHERGEGNKGSRC